MVDVFDPFDGVAKFKKFCETLDAPIKYKAQTPAEGSTLYDIYKTTTNQHDSEFAQNKCVGIGFTYEEAQWLIKKRMKIKVDHKNDVVTMYRIVPQNNKEAINPFWNSKEVVKEC